MTAPELEALAGRCETAAADMQADLIADAWDALGPRVRWTAEQAGCVGRMVDAEAYESAAMLLVPEGWAWTLHSDASVGTGLEPQRGACLNYMATAEAATLALALCAAFLRAHAIEVSQSGAKP